MRGCTSKFLVLFAAIVVCAGTAIFNTSRLRALPFVSGPETGASQANAYRALAPIQSGNLTIFPVVQVSGSGKATGWQYLTLDEGLKSGDVVVTEAGRARGLVRPPEPGGLYPPPFEDQVNQLVLVNNSSEPLVLLAGEIVTGGKQDRVIGKDRIVPPQSDPIDLSVFCIEPGRWVLTSEQFGAAGKGSSSFMVQPSVRQEAMVTQDQQRVWTAVGGAINGLTASRPAQTGELPPATTSYAKTMQQEAVAREVDQTGDALPQQREQILAKLRQAHAVGVVAAVRGQIIWADIFANPDLLAKYWTKLVRSYAAEALTSPGQSNSPATQEDAQRFLNQASSGHEIGEGEVGVYRYSELHAGDEISFVLHVLLPGTDFDVHISKTRTEFVPIQPLRARPPHRIRPD